LIAALIDRQQHPMGHTIPFAHLEHHTKRLLTAGYLVWRQSSYCLLIILIYITLTTVLNFYMHVHDIIIMYISIVQP